MSRGPAEESSIIKLLSRRSPSHSSAFSRNYPFSSVSDSSSLFVLGTAVSAGVEVEGGRGMMGVEGGWLTDWLAWVGVKLWCLLGSHSAGQCAVLHPVPRPCVNSAAVTIYSSCPSSIWRVERGAERVLLPSRQSEANLLQRKNLRSREEGRAQRYTEASVWDFVVLMRCAAAASVTLFFFLLHHRVLWSRISAYSAARFSLKSDLDSWVEATPRRWHRGQQQYSTTKPDVHLHEI